jgi:hypothetical protein
MVFHFYLPARPKRLPGTPFLSSRFFHGLNFIFQPGYYSLPKLKTDQGEIK